MLLAISNIEMEAKSRGLLDEARLIGIFKIKEEKQQIQEMYDGWYTIRETLFGDHGREGAQILEAKLSELLEMNQRFLEMGLRRLAELVKES